MNWNNAFEIQPEPYIDVLVSDGVNVWIGWWALGFWSYYQSDDAPTLGAITKWMFLPGA